MSKLWTFFRRADQPKGKALLMNEENQILADADGEPVVVDLPAPTAPGDVEPPADVGASAIVDVMSHPDYLALLDRATKAEAVIASQREAEMRSRLVAVETAAIAFYDRMAGESEQRVVPAVREHLVGLHQSLGRLDLENPPADGQQGLVATLEAMVAGLPKYGLREQKLAASDGDAALDNAGQNEGPMTQERKFELLAASSDGRATLERSEEGRRYLEKNRERFGIFRRG